jgi:hypothetical protein
MINGQPDATRRLPRRHRDTPLVDTSFGSTICARAVIDAHLLASALSATLSFGRRTRRCTRSNPDRRGAELKRTGRGKGEGKGKGEERGRGRGMSAEDRG